MTFGIDFFRSVTSRMTRKQKSVTVQCKVRRYFESPSGDALFAVRVNW